AQGGPSATEESASVALVHLVCSLNIFFFFQAEDGIRYWSVTGVQTCALPISAHRRRAERPARALGAGEALRRRRGPRQRARAAEIGRASCRERGQISGGAGCIEKKVQGSVRSRRGASEEIRASKVLIRRGGPL